LDDAGAVLAGALEEAPEGRFALGLPEDLTAACSALRDAAREVMSAMAAEQPRAGQEGARQAARGAVSEILDVAERLASGSAGPQGPDVAWVSRFRRPDGATRVGLHIAPL